MHKNDVVKAEILSKNWKCVFKGLYLHANMITPINHIQMEDNSKNISLFDGIEETKIIESPFVGRKVIVEGVFHSIKKEALKTKIKRLGGEIMSGDVTKSINYFVMGDNVASDKMEKYNKLRFDGYHIKTLSEADILNILNGEVHKYLVAKENVKDLHLTIEHYKRKHVVYQEIATDANGLEYMPNPLYGKNIYLGQGITGNRMILSQMLGLVGVFAGQGLSDSTQIIVLSHEAYDALRGNNKHPELTLIQDTYNRGLAQWYDYLLTTEEELLSWYKNRINLSYDSVCDDVYTKFIESKQNG